MNNIKKVLPLLPLLVSYLFYSPIALAKKDKSDSWYFMWGYNRSYYSESDIHFNGDLNGQNYNFTLNDVKASDSPANFGAVYFDSSKWLIPQYNFRFGYFLDNNHAITFGMDHMKYVVNQNQSVPIQGTTINNGSLVNHAIGSSQELTTDFLTFEHTDGLNYFSLDLETYSHFWSNDSIAINTLYGLGGGFVIPKSNVQLFNGVRNDEFHAAGTGLSAKLAIQVDFLDDYFIRLALKKGYMNLNDVKTTSGNSNKASQEFEFTEFIFSGGVYY